jgi:hypothetical protein
VGHLSKVFVRWIPVVAAVVSQGQPSDWGVGGGGRGASQRAHKLIVGRETPSGPGICLGKIRTNVEESES